MKGQPSKLFDCIFNNFTQSKTGSSMNFRVAVEHRVVVQIERFRQ